MSEFDHKYKTLFLRAKAGDEIAYREVLSGVAQLLRNYLMRTMNPRLRSREQVEDLVQEVLISIHRKRDLYDEELAFLPWIYAIARYRLIDSLRMEARRPECVEWIEKFDALAVTEMPESEEADGRELLEGLDEKQKQIVRLAKVEELPMAEIAEKMGMSLSAVKVTLHRTLKALRKKVRSKGYG